MTGRIRQRGAHWGLQRDLLAVVGRTLIAHAERAQRTYADLGVTRQEWARLVEGTAGFPLTVKAATRLGVVITLTCRAAEASLSTDRGTPTGNVAEPFAADHGSTEVSLAEWVAACPTARAKEEYAVLRAAVVGHGR